MICRFEVVEQLRLVIFDQISFCFGLNDDLLVDQNISSKFTDHFVAVVDFDFRLPNRLMP